MMPTVLPDKACILIVDDRPEKVLALEAVLEGLGQTIVHAHSGREALRHVLRQEFAVILLDVNMPGMDGFETADLIRQRPSSRHVPIIFITAFTDEMYANRGYSLGAVDYIQAPVLPDVLRTKVAVFVDLYRKSQQLRRQADQQRERAGQLHKLAAASVAINGAMAIGPMLRTLADSARDVLGAHQAVLLYNGEPGARKPVPVGVGSFSARYHDWQNRALDVSALARTSVAKSRTVTHLTDAQLHAHPDWDVFGNLVIPPVTNGVLAVPLCGRAGETLGLLYVTDPQGPPFDADDEALLVQLAQIGAVAIENTLYSNAREANRAKDEFLATLSHELRTPLNAILGWTELMKTEPMTDELAHAFQVIDRSAKAQAKLIEDLLEVSRINSGKLQITPRPMELRPVIEAALDAVRPMADAKRIELKFDPLPLPELIGDPDRLQQVVWNLLSNAVKFTPENGTVSVIAAHTPACGGVEIAVRDSGQGLSAEFLPHVFERFRQADSSSTRRHGGLGIGLTIVRHIVQLHGGTVSVHSDGVDQGSTFSCTLPVCTAILSSGAAPDVYEEDDAASGLDGLDVLLVEDDADARDMLATLLRRFEANVVAADSVRSAMSSLIARTPDLIISDISMPDEDGYELIRRVQAATRDTGTPPAIALTANVRAGDRERTLAAGYCEHVAKPVKPADLLAAARRALGRRAAEA